MCMCVCGCVGVYVWLSHRRCNKAMDSRVVFEFEYICLRMCVWVVGYVCVCILPICIWYVCFWMCIYDVLKNVYVCVHTCVGRVICLYKLTNHHLNSVKCLVSFSWERQPAVSLLSDGLLTDLLFSFSQFHLVFVPKSNYFPFCLLLFPILKFSLIYLWWYAFTFLIFSVGFLICFHKIINTHSPCCTSSNTITYICFLFFFPL